MAELNILYLIQPSFLVDKRQLPTLSEKLILVISGEIGYMKETKSE